VGHVVASFIKRRVVLFLIEGVPLSLLTMPLLDLGLLDPDLSSGVTFNRRPYRFKTCHQCSRVQGRARCRSVDPAVLKIGHQVIYRPEKLGVP
jgi:hypothetical protein